MKIHLSRRKFIHFMGGTLSLAYAPTKIWALSPQKKILKRLSPDHKDELSLVEGLSYKVLISSDAAINKQGELFGHNNDYTAIIPISENRAYLWVNHEYMNPLFVSGYNFHLEKLPPRTQEQVDKERKTVGGSLLEIKRNKGTFLWEVDLSSEINTRYDATTKIPFANNIVVGDSSIAEGTLANCAGGVTPWKTFLTCEENFDDFYGNAPKGSQQIEGGELGWRKFYPNDPKHYGWVNEINPKTKKIVKHTSLGRFAHESATAVLAKDGRCVVYSGDDKEGEHLYKFISKNKNDLSEGTLYVADFKKKKWIPLDWSEQKSLQKNFKNQLEVLTYAREASKLLGGTPLDRPEDIEIHPFSKDVYVALTNNFDKKNLKDPKNNFYGKILKIMEKDGDHLSLDFEFSNFFVGGEKSLLACPDNLVFDKKGNLWVATDMSGTLMNISGPYEAFGNNGLFYIPLSGKHAGEAFLVAQMPVDAECTGICFSPDYKTLFVSVQHPGEKSPSLDHLTSHWPNGGKEVPLSSVVQIYGDYLDQLML